MFDMTPDYPLQAGAEMLRCGATDMSGYSAWWQPFSAGVKHVKKRRPAGIRADWPCSAELMQSLVEYKSMAGRRQERQTETAILARL